MPNPQETLLISCEDQKQIFNDGYQDALRVVEKFFCLKADGQETLSPKVSMIFDEKTQSRINCMPAVLKSSELCGVKWVSVFPDNPRFGYKNVTGTIIISELKYGHTLSIMDAGYLTSIRTAAVGALAAKFLSREDSEIVGFIGAGQEARRHLDLLKLVRPNIKTCYVSSRSTKTVASFIEEEKALHPDINFVPCGSDYETAVCGADIIITATSGQSDILKSRWINKDGGVLYIHVAGWEDEYAVAQMASKIVCDDWNSVKKRSQTLSRMYLEGLIDDSNIYANLEDLIVGRKKSREDRNEFIYFCSVGLANIDVAIANYVYEKCKENGLGMPFVF